MGEARVQTSKSSPPLLFGGSEVKRKVHSQER